MYGSEWQLVEGLFSLFTLWDPGVEVGSSGLEASAFTCHAILLAPRLIFLTN